MENIDLEIKILDYLQGRLSETERKEVEGLQRTSQAFTAKFNEVKQVWEGLDIRQVPETGPEMRTNFKAMLNTFELEQAHSQTNQFASTWKKLTGLLVYRTRYNWAYSILLLIIGAMIMYLFLKPQRSVIEDLSQQLNDKKQTIMLTMLENPTATERMKAVNYTHELHTVNDKVINALLATLNTDDNENVRLVTLDALVKLADNPKVREGLVASIVNQDSELMQIALADAMLQLQEKKSVRSLKKILKEQPDMNDMSKRKLEQTVQKLETI
ncbi:MAG: HEAT repeat domain-containing protein [Mucilaginibacter sp.]